MASALAVGVQRLATGVLVNKLVGHVAQHGMTVLTAGESAKTATKAAVTTKKVLGNIATTPLQMPPLPPAAAAAAPAAGNIATVPAAVPAMVPAAVSTLGALGAVASLVVNIATLAAALWVVGSLAALAGHALVAAGRRAVRGVRELTAKLELDKRWDRWQRERRERQERRARRARRRRGETKRGRGWRQEEAAMASKQGLERKKHGGSPSSSRAKENRGKRKGGTVRAEAEAAKKAETASGVARPADGPLFIGSSLGADSKEAGPTQSADDEGLSKGALEPEVRRGPTRDHHQAAALPTAALGSLRNLARGVAGLGTATLLLLIALDRHRSRGRRAAPKAESGAQPAVEASAAARAGAMEGAKEAVEEGGKEHQGTSLVAALSSGAAAATPPSKHALAQATVVARAGPLRSLSPLRKTPEPPRSPFGSKGKGAPHEPAWALPPPDLSRLSILADKLPDKPAGPVKNPLSVGGPASPPAGGPKPLSSNPLRLDEGHSFSGAASPGPSPSAARASLDPRSVAARRRFLGVYLAPGLASVASVASAGAQALGAKGGAKGGGKARLLAASFLAAKASAASAASAARRAREGRSGDPRGATSPLLAGQTSPARSRVRPPTSPKMSPQTYLELVRGLKEEARSDQEKVPPAFAAAASASAASAWAAAAAAARPRGGETPSRTTRTNTRENFTFFNPLFSPARSAPSPSPSPGPPPEPSPSPIPFTSQFEVSEFSSLEFSSLEFTSDLALGGASPDALAALELAVNDAVSAAEAAMCTAMHDTAAFLGGSRAEAAAGARAVATSHDGGQAGGLEEKVGHPRLALPRARSLTPLTSLPKGSPGGPRGFSGGDVGVGGVGAEGSNASKGKALLAQAKKGINWKSYTRGGSPAASPSRVVVASTAGEKSPPNPALLDPPSATQDLLAAPPRTVRVTSRTRRERTPP